MALVEAFVDLRFLALGSQLVWELMALVEAFAGVGSCSLALSSPDSLALVETIEQSFLPVLSRLSLNN